MCLRFLWRRHRARRESAAAEPVGTARLSCVVSACVGLSPLRPHRGGRRACPQGNRGQPQLRLSLLCRHVGLRQTWPSSRRGRGSAPAGPRRPALSARVVAQDPLGRRGAPPVRPRTVAGGTTARISAVWAKPTVKKPRECELLHLYSTKRGTL